MPVVVNNLNVYDSIGDRHNKGVDSIIPYLDPHRLTYESDIKGYTISYLATYGYNARRLQNDYSLAHTGGYLTYTNMMAFDSLIDKYFRDGRMSSIGQIYLKRLSNLMNTVIGSNDPDANIYLSFANTVKTYENEVSSDNTLTPNEQMALLSVHSVARYSANYCANYYLCNLSGLCPDCLRNHWFRWWKVLTMDVAGALVGFIDDPHGALVGAIGGSVGEAVSEIYDHITQR